MKPTVFLLFSALVLGGIALVRPPEYDEAYSMFLTAGDARPAWPSGVFTAGAVRVDYLPRGGFGQIARDLKAGDVHPPLYFWLLEVWRRVVGPGWFAARLLSVGLSVASLGLVGLIAAALEIPVLPAMALTLGCYGFAYTGVVARGFALAQVLNLLGFWLVLRERGFWGGAAFGAASFANYLAVFSFAAALTQARIVIATPRESGGKQSIFLPENEVRKMDCFVAHANARIRATLLAMTEWAGRRTGRRELLGILPFFFLDWSFFAAQRGSRGAQFVAFSWGHSAWLLVKDFGASVFGGLPVYFGAWVALPLLALFVACLVRVRWEARLVAGACAPAVGLVGLGLVFGNTPIEIRYLAFGLPFLALMLATLPRGLLGVVLAVQVCAIAGLALAPATMQKQGIAAREAAALAPGALILVPFGNDGVGVVGPFVAALPDAARVEVLRQAMPRLAGEKAVVLAELGVDDASRAQTAGALDWFAARPCFVVRRRAPLAVEFLNRCAEQKP